MYVTRENEIKHTIRNSRIERYSTQTSQNTTDDATWASARLVFFLHRERLYSSESPIPGGDRDCWMMHRIGITDRLLLVCNTNRGFIVVWVRSLPYNVHDGTAQMYVLYVFGMVLVCGHYWCKYLFVCWFS
jgi:hypothetical protein